MGDSTQRRDKGNLVQRYQRPKNPLRPPRQSRTGQQLQKKYLQEEKIDIIPDAFKHVEKKLPWFANLK